MRFKLCRQPLFEQKDAAPSQFRTHSAPLGKVDRDVVVILNPGNEIDVKSPLARLFAEVAERSAQAFLRLRESALQEGRNGVVEIQLLLLAIVNNVMSLPDPPEDGLALIDVERILGGVDYPRFASKIVEESGELKNYIEAGLFQQWHDVHPEMGRRLLVMPRIFTDTAMFDEQVKHITLVTHQKYDPAKPSYPYREMLFTDAETMEKIVFVNVEEDKGGKS
jgi:hypothetical protein